jgi:hypothetical protein
MTDQRAGRREQRPGATAMAGGGLRVLPPVAVSLGYSW